MLDKQLLINKESAAQAVGDSLISLQPAKVVSCPNRQTAYKIVNLLEKLTFFFHKMASCENQRQSSDVFNLKIC